MNSIFRFTFAVAVCAALGGFSSPAATRTVDAGASLALNGKALQDAIDAAQPGDVIKLKDGATYEGNIVLKHKGDSAYIGKSNPYITIEGASWILPGNRATPQRAARMPKIVSPNTSPAIQTEKGAHHYRLIGLEVFAADGIDTDGLIDLGPSTATKADDLAYEIELDRLYIHGDPKVGGKRGIALNSKNAAIKSCYISGFRRSDQDSQAISGWNGLGPYRIVNNYLEAAGENILFGGATMNIKVDQDHDGTYDLPSDITIRENYFSKPLEWMDKPTLADCQNGKHPPASVKNLLELKFARRVAIESNLFEHNWVQACADGQSGFAIVMQARNQSGAVPWAEVEHVTFKNNIVRSAGGGINIDAKAGSSPDRASIMEISGNLFYDINGDEWGGCCKGSAASGFSIPMTGIMFQLLNGPNKLTLDSNTIIQKRNAGAPYQDGGKRVISFEGKDATLATFFTFTNNIVHHGAEGVFGGGSIGANALKAFTKDYSFSGNVIVGGAASLYPPNNYFPSTFEQLSFLNAAVDDYRVTSANVDYKTKGANMEALWLSTKGITEGTFPYRNFVGDDDHFAQYDPSVDAPKLSDAVQQIIAGTGKPSAGLDVGGANRPVGVTHWFELPPSARITYAWVNILRKATDAGASNDTITLEDGTQLNLEEYGIGSTNVLNLGKVADRTGDFIPANIQFPAQSSRYLNLLPLLFDGDFGFVIQDDSMVDYSYLLVVYTFDFSPAGDLDGDNQVTQTDLDIIRSVVDSPAYTSGGIKDPRDLNNDGKITAIDVSLLKAKCSGCR